MTPSTLPAALSQDSNAFLVAHSSEGTASNAESPVLTPAPTAPGATAVARFAGFREMANSVLTSTEVAGLVALVQAKLGPALEVEGLAPRSWSTPTIKTQGRLEFIRTNLRIVDSLTAAESEAALIIGFDRTPMDIILRCTLRVFYLDAKRSSGELPGVYKAIPYAASLSEVHDLARETLAGHLSSLKDEYFASMALSLSLALMP